MTTLTTTQPPHEYDFRQSITKRRLAGLWRMMTGFRLSYLGAAASLTIAALARTGNTLLLRYFADTLLAFDKASSSIEQFSRTMALIALAFLCIALVEGSMTFLSGRLSAYTAEGIVRRLRNFIFDHTQRLPRGSGAIEKNQEVLIGRAMKKRGMAWSAQGAHHLAKLIFAYQDKQTWPSLWTEPLPP